MPTNPEAYRTMVLLDNETQVGLPGSCWLSPTQYTLDPATRMLTLLGAAGAATIWSATLTPAALAAGQTNDYAPGSLTTVNRLRLSADAAGSQISGLVPTGIVDGQVIVVTNISANDLTLLAASAASAAANRFAINGDQVLGQGQSITLLYDTGLARWTQV